MCKSKKTTEGSSTSQQKRNWVRILSFCIIGTCIFLLLALLGLMAWRATNNNPDVYRVIVTPSSMPDSLDTSTYITFEQADSLIKAVKAYDDQLTQKYQYLIEQKEQDNQVFYWGSLIVGIVVAVFGWFGFQSFTTIEDKAKSNAGKVAATVAKRTAWKETKVFLKEEGKKQINVAAKDILKEEEIKKVKDLVLNELNTTIDNRIRQCMPEDKYDRLQNEIDSLEASIQPKIEKAVRDALDDLFDKLKRQNKGAEKGKEEQK